MSKYFSFEEFRLTWVQFQCQKQFHCKQFNLAVQVRSLNANIDRTLSGATTPGQSGPGSDGNEGVLRIRQSSSINGTSPSDCLVSYPEHSLLGGVTRNRKTVGKFYSTSRLVKKENRSGTNP